ncbi:nucleoplasmin-like [Pristis pectinata]|uniref:nucleoplasmin-like n=1 Tax=Pristis pectinata TaxID=685728 RepID=UPI00223D14F2|nr:nucleoplasmin-like [Pristis pectinata]
MTSNRSKTDKPVAVLWGCELNAQQKTQKFEITDDEVAEHHLALKTICLGVGAKDELNIVEIVSPVTPRTRFTSPVSRILDNEKSILCYFFNRDLQADSLCLGFACW